MALLPLSQGDRKLIHSIALEWVSSGGDRDGFEMVNYDIADEIERITEEKKLEGV